MTRRMTHQMKHLWQSMAFNAGAFLLNLTLVVRSINNGSWLWVLNGAAVCMSLYMVYYLVGRIKQVREEEKERVIDILSGKVHYHG